jgi:hypothetical protein
VICGWVVKAAPRWVPTDARVTATFVAAPTAIRRENEDVVAEVVLLSKKVAVIGKVPLREGVPEITPVLEFKVKPAGRVPVTEKVPDPEPPPDTSVNEYALPTVPLSPVVGVVIVEAGIA